MYLMMVLLVIIKFSKVVCQFSNLDSIEHLIESHDFGGNTTTDEEYNFCIETKESQFQEDIFGPFQKSVMEMSDVSLPCSPCRYGSRPTPQWVKLTFENEHIDLVSNKKYLILPNDTLVIKSARFEDFGTYYCLTEGYVGYIWSLEIEDYEDLEVVKAKRWTENPTYFEEMTVYTHWGEWSDCNKCDQIGKRHRLGFCFVQGDPHVVPNNFKALDIYRSGLSCNLFLNIHPDIDAELIALLAKSPIMMLGFCKIPCDYFNADPAQSFSRLHPKIQDIYVEQIQHQSKEYYRNRIKLVRGILPGKPTTFEAASITLLVVLELYIIVHVCRNMGKAK